MYLSDILVLLAVLLYTLKQGNCALQKQNDDDTKEKENKDTGDDVDELAEIAKVMTKNQFKDMINWIEKGKVCMRNGVKAEKACYQLDDFQKDKPEIINQAEMIRVMKWTMNPDSDPSYTKLWYDRLYNAIYFSVFSSKEKSEKKTTFLLAKYTSSGNERYPVGRGIGLKETSSKAQVDEQIGRSIDINVEDAVKDVPKNVRHVLEWMEGILRVKNTSE